MFLGVAAAEPLHNFNARENNGTGLSDVTQSMTAFGSFLPRMVNAIEESALTQAETLAVTQDRLGPHHQGCGRKQCTGPVHDICRYGWTPACLGRSEASASRRQAVGGIDPRPGFCRTRGPPPG